MQPRKAHVHNGCLVLDEQVLAAGGDYMDEEDRARLHDLIERGLEDVKAGRTVEASKVVERLRARAAKR